MNQIIHITGHGRIGKWVYFYEVPSESDPSKAYIVSADASFENMGCSCPRWIYHRVQCKHIQRLQNERRMTGRFVTSDKVAPITPAEKLCRALSRFANIDVD